MKVIELDSSKVVIPGDRMRKSVGNLTELVSSIQKHGQLHPIVVTAQNILVSGERRLTACRELGIAVHAVIRDDLSPQDQLELELMENAARLDLSWTEQVRAVKKLHDHGVASQRKWSYADTGKAVGRSDESVRLDVQIATAIEEFPELEKLNRKTDALRNLRNIWETRVEQELLARAVSDAAAGVKANEKKETRVSQKDLVDIAELTDEDKAAIRALLSEPGNAEPSVPEPGDDSDGGPSNQEAPARPSPVARIDGDPLAFFSDVLRQGDFFSLAPTQIPDESIHLVICDPPYGIEVGETTAEKYVGVFDDGAAWIHEFGGRLLREIHRVLTKNAHAYIFIALDFLPFWKDEATKAGFTFDPLPIIWVKGAQVGRSGEPQKYPGRSYESILYLRKGDLPLAKRGRGNIVIADPVLGRDKIHPTEKPIEVIVNLIERSGYPGSVILDPCAGSGSTIEAALHTGHKCYGYELDSANHAKAVHRLARWYERVTKGG